MCGMIQVSLTRFEQVRSISQIHNLLKDPSASLVEFLCFAVAGISSFLFQVLPVGVAWLLAAGHYV